MNTVYAVRIAIVSLLLLFATPLPKLSFSLVDVTTELGSVTDNVEPVKDEIVKDTASVVEDDTVAKTVEGGAEIAEETSSAIDDTAEVVEEETASTIDETTEIAEGTAEDIVEETTSGSQESRSAIDDTTDIVDDAADRIVQEITSVEEETVEIVDEASDSREAAKSAIDDTANDLVAESSSAISKTSETLDDTTADLVEGATSTIEDTEDIAEEPAGEVVEETTSTIGETSSVIDDTADDLVQETTNSIGETTDIVDKTIDEVVEGTTSTVDETTSTIGATAEIVEDTTDDIVEATTGGIVEETASGIVEETTSTIEEVADDVAEGTKSTIDKTTDIVDHAANVIVEAPPSTVDKTVEIVDEAAGGIIDEPTSAIDDTTSTMDETDGRAVAETSSTIGETTNVVDEKAADIVEESSSVKDEAADGLVEETRSTGETADDIVEETPSTIDETTEIAEQATGDIVDKTTDIVADIISGTTSISEPAEIAEEVANPISNANEEINSSLDDSADAVESTNGIIEEPVSTAKETPDVNAEKGNDIVVEATGTSHGVIANQTIGTADEAVGTVKEQTGAGPANGILEETKTSSLSSAASRLEVIPLTGEGNNDVQIISNPKLTQEEKQQVIEEALNVEGLKKWSSEGGWKVVGMDFIGSVEPRPLWEEAIVYLHLPNNVGNPPVSCQQGWHAVIDINLDAGKVTDAGYPTLSSHECTSAIVLEEPDKLKDDAHSANKNRIEEGNNPLSLSSPSRPSFLIAGTDDVISNDIYGTAAFLNTPSYNSSIFEHMDSYMAFMLNQKWSTLPVQHMTQIGWLMTSIEGCVDCGSQYIGRNSTALAFTDSSVFGNLEAHNIPIFQWKNDEDLVAGTWCNEDGNYMIWTQYAGKVFNHNTNISCEHPDNDSKISNSIFFENWNTAGSSSWADHVLGQVEAHSAVVFSGIGESGDYSAGNIMNWQNSTNEKQDCTGSRELTETIEGSLASGKTAKWMNLSDTPSAC
jgi:ElaB/YqjD/DUF883 family membrane-anchored ribosome-binding protein